MPQTGSDDFGFLWISRKEIYIENAIDEIYDEIYDDILKVLKVKAIVHPLKKPDFMSINDYLPSMKRDLSYQR